MTGYGFSTRPAPMDDPCNLAAVQQALLPPSWLPDTCAPAYTTQVTTLRSDWDDLDGAVDYMRGGSGRGRSPPASDHHKAR